MQIEITKQVPVQETIEIDFPYYYKHDLYPEDSESCIYGKITENKLIAIHIRSSWKYDPELEISIELSNTHASQHTCYLKPKYKSTEEEYLSAKTRLLNFIASEADE